MKHFKIRKTCSIFCYIPLGFAFLIPRIIILSYQTNIPIFDSIFKNINCVDEYTIQAFDNYNIKYQGIRQMTLSSFILALIIFISEIIFSCLICAYKPHEN